MAKNKKGEQGFLDEIQHSVEWAESRCNILTQQVGMFKKIFHDKNGDMYSESLSESLSKSSSVASISIYPQNKMPRPRTVSNSDNKRIYKEASDKYVSLEKEFKSDLSTVPQRDINSSKFRTTNEATKSINSIISGITASVNKLTHLQVKIAPTSSAIHESVGIQNVQCSPKNAKQNTEAEKPYQDNKTIKPDTSSATVKSKTPRKPKKKVKPFEKQVSSKEESDSCMKNSKIRNITNEKLSDTKECKSNLVSNSSYLRATKFRSAPPVKVQAVSSRNLGVKKITRNQKTNNCKKSDHLVELYHNSAMNFETVSGDNIVINNPAPNLITESKSCRFETATQKGYLPPIDENKELNINTFPRRYALPTIASKMKQVAKNYRNFNFRTIPFVAARSTTQSHNLGINIQQMLSVLKGGKASEHISPTLAYNIALANNMPESDPLFSYFSRFGSYKHHPRNTCPADSRSNNYDPQEMPQDEMHSNTNEDNTCPSAGSGDKSMPHSTARTWSGDPNKNKQKCTCMPKSGTNFEEICAKYIPESRTSTRQRMNSNQGKKVRSKFSATSSYSTNPKNNTSENIKQPKKCKTLKEVLKFLYEDFEQMNNQHEELKCKVTNQTVDNMPLLLQELEELEQQLQQKEDEIRVVIELHKEVVNLKQQVKTLKKRASQPSVTAMPYRQRTYNESNPKVHLVHLLRHVQQIQTTLKSKTKV